MDKLKYIRIAHELNQKLSETLLEEEFHFRGNLNSFSLISLSKSSPEIGFSGLKTEAAGLKQYNEIIKPNFKLTKERDTREKELQAWIILNALKNGNQLFFDNNIKFLTSELALTTVDPQKRVVNDILGLDNDNTLVVIELKSVREKKRLEEQIHEFNQVIAQDKTFFSDLVLYLTEKKWNGKVKNIIVWPDAPTVSKKNWLHDIIEITYQEVKVDGVKGIKYDSDNNIIFEHKK